MDDEIIIELFLNRSENAIQKLDERYGKIFKRISMNIVNNEQDAEECVNDTYMCVWNTIPPNKPNPLLAYVCKIVRNISIDCYRHNSAHKRMCNYALCLDEIDAPDFACSPSEKMELQELSKEINEFIGKLAPIDRVFFVKRYWFMDSYSKISSETGFRVGTIRTRVSRVRNRLYNHLKKAGWLYER